MTIGAFKEVNMKTIETDASYGLQPMNMHHQLKERNYWLNKLSGELEKTTFPFHLGKTGKHHPEPELNALNFDICGELFSKLMRLANNSDIRLYVILMTLLVLLLEKYTRNRDIIVGAPIYRQDTEGNFINRIVILRNRLKESMSFKELLLQVSQTNFEAVEHINYPLENIPYELGMAFADEEFLLFDVALLLENLHDKSYIQHLNLKMIFSFSREEDRIEGVVEYNGSLYSEGAVRQIIAHFNNLMAQALGDIDAKIKDLSVMSREEMKRLAIDINANSAAEALAYPQEKMIHQLFRDQVRRTPNHMALQYKEKGLTYQQLDEKADCLARWLKHKGVETETLVAILLERSPLLITALLAVLKAGGTYLPIDPEYLMSRIHYLLKDSQTSYLISTPPLADAVEFSGIRIQPEETEFEPGKPAENHDHHPGCLAYVMYTSGSTGKPKGVMIPHAAVVNYVWWAAQTYTREEKSDFPLYSSISFDLTVTSIFTPLITGNRVIIYDGEEKNFLIEKIVDENKTEVIKLTPSHLYVIRGKTFRDSNIKCFIVGGEFLESKIAHEISDKFAGNVNIYNEYGPTEATVGCLIHKFNPAADHSPGVPIGLPISGTRVYILNRDLKPVPVGVSGEIYVSGRGVARGYLNSPELTAEKFIKLEFKVEVEEEPRQQTPNPVSRIPNKHLSYMSHMSYTYRTGDLARWLPAGNVEFLGRRDHQVKIRGYRIELAEIEQNLLEHEHITEAVVIARDAEEKTASEEKQDQYLCAYFVSDKELQISELREHLLKNLPDYMVPLFFVQLEAIPLTSNGKINKKALPIPEIKKEYNYVAPRNEREKKLAEIWAKVLRIDHNIISIDTSFLELGGQSLKQVDLISQVQKEFDVRVPLAELFKRQTIQELSEYIAGAEKDEYIVIRAVEKKEYYSLSSSQKRMYVVHQMYPASTSYNTPAVVQLTGQLDLPHLEYIFGELIRRHENLRTSFRMINNEPVQIIHSQAEFEIEYRVLEGTGHKEEGLERNKDFIRPFDLSKAPLIRVRVIKTAEQEHLLMVDMNHIISDGYSMGLLTADFMALYNRQMLPPLPIQYKDFSQWQSWLFESGKIKKQEEYWLDQFKGDIPVLKIQTDYPRPEVRNIDEGAVVNFSLGKDLTSELSRVAKENNTTLFILLFAAYNVLLFKYTGQEDVVVAAPITGRSHADLENVAGVFLNMLAIRNYPRPGQGFEDFLEQVKTRALDSFENQDYPYDLLVSKLKLHMDTSRNPLFDVEFAMNRIDIPTLEIPGLKLEAANSGNQFAKFDLHLLALENNDNINVILRYSTALFKPSSIEKLKKYYIEILEQVVENLSIKLGDIAVSHQLLSAASGIQKDSDSDFVL